jgi:hypothetical protein
VVNFGLKTAGVRFAEFRPQNLGMNFEAEHGVNGKFASRQSYIVNGSWPSDERISTLTIMPLGSGRISNGRLGIV